MASLLSTHTVGTFTITGSLLPPSSWRSLPVRRFSPRRRSCHGNSNGVSVANSPATSTSQTSGSDCAHPTPTSTTVLTFQQAIQRLQEYWASVGCTIMQCSNTEVGAGTMNPLTFLRVLGPEPWNVVYPEPSIRPDDSRYGDNPNRLQRHTQFQVILKPDPGNSQNLFVHSLSALGIDVNQHDIRFVEDNWESPVLGAWGLGWEVWMDGMEITQFTYFQQAGSMQLQPVSVEITYGLERILMLLQGVDHFKKIKYSDGITYGELFMENEKEMSAYNLEHANVQKIQKHFEDFEEEARSLLSLGLAVPAYDQLLKASHAFNILDSRGFVGVTERARYFGRMRSLARECAQLWVKTRESLGHPLGTVTEAVPLNHPDNIVDNLKKVHEFPRAFVLEVGTEEMPPNDVVDAGEQLRRAIIRILEKRRLSHGRVEATGTPRRLVIYIEELTSRQQENVIEIRGPPSARAFDHQGNPTKAAEGFCRKHSVSTECLYKKVEGKTEYVYIRIRETGKFAMEIMSEDLPSTIAKVSFGKSMRWNSQVMFSRPIRWILAMHGELVVPFVFAGLASGNLSCGLRNSPSATLKVGNAESYMDAIRKAGILIDMKERKEKIVKDSILLAESVSGNPIMQDSVLEEVVNLVEAPVPILGRFSESFLELPKDILVTVMQKHQKYFAVTDKSTGKLLPFFVAVANGNINVGVVQKGNEAVLRARYEDAKFFYMLDTKRKFSEFRGCLSGILFHEKLGTMLDKVSRIQKTVSKLSIALDIEESSLQIVEDAAELAMSDLATSVVAEFTALSGVMARHYALKDGYSEQIAEALFEIMLPRFSGDALPKTDAGTVLAIADRLDSLIGLFGAGCQPSSTNDPFGLRRISYGLVQILVENKKNLDLMNALRLVAEVQPIEITMDVITSAHQFVTRRLEQLLVDNGIAPEVVRSVLLERSNWPSLAAQSAEEMEALSKGELLPKVVEAYSRPTRIIRGKDIDPNLEVLEDAFQQDEEWDLWNSYLAVKKGINPGASVIQFVEASSQLVQPLHNFFENVFVMEEDERIRKNRLLLLQKIASLPNGIVDLSVLPGF